jgi:membrane-bound lytic murein transglycosylase MltF
MGARMKYLAIVILGLFAVAAFFMSTGKKAVAAVRGYEETFKRFATQNNVPWLRAMAIGMQESSLQAIGTHPDGVSTGIMGVTQVALSDINQHFNRSFTLAEMTDPEKCIDAGTLYLRLCIEVLTDLDLATQAYNQGYPRVRNNPRAGLDYLGNVLRRESELKDEAGF